MLNMDIETQHLAAQNRLAQMDNYYQWIFRHFAEVVGKRVWDAGAGIGHLTEILCKQAQFVYATEFTEKNLAILHKRFANDKQVQIAFCDLTTDDALHLIKYQFDTIMSLDVLEHLEDDRQTLRLFAKILAPEGRLLLKVPAHPFLYGSIDEASLHYRRYAKRDLKNKLEEAGFHLEKLSYMNMVATVPYFIKSRLLKINNNFSNSLDGNRLSFYNHLMPWLERAERIIPPPFGLSLIAIGHKL
jgi:2-polyprenyl-3-methyl-5-hydroxy-6-metoxy-1,4-benzoquinol methylase